MKTESGTPKFHDITGTITNYEGEAETMTLAEYLHAYWSDNTTTPRGIAPRLHVVEEMRWDEEEEGDVPRYRVATWGLKGNHPALLGYVFDTKREAEEYILFQWLKDSRSVSSDAPVFIAL